MLQEPKLLRKKPCEGGQKLLKFRFRAFHRNPLGFPAIQGEKAHERGGIDMESVSAHDEPVLLVGSQCHKIQNVPQRVKLNIELVHFFIPPRCTKYFLSCIMGEWIPNRLDVQYYITFL
mgnify:CR=1 FL=1